MRLRPGPALAILIARWLPVSAVRIDEADVEEHAWSSGATLSSSSDGEAGQHGASWSSPSSSTTAGQPDGGGIEKSEKALAFEVKAASETVRNKELEDEASRRATTAADRAAADAARAAAKATREAHSAASNAEAADVVQKEAEHDAEKAAKNEDTTAEKVAEAKSVRAAAVTKEKAADANLGASLDCAARERFEESQTDKQFEENLDEAEVEERNEKAKKSGKKKEEVTPEKAEMEVKVAKMRSKELSGEIKKKKDELKHETQETLALAEGAVEKIREDIAAKKAFDHKKKNAEALRKAEKTAAQVLYAQISYTDAGSDVVPPMPQVSTAAPSEEPSEDTAAPDETSTTKARQMLVKLKIKATPDAEASEVPTGSSGETTSAPKPGASPTASKAR
eukprot:TRINITY_DN113994_c0_g1_i1.p1 TRINITY_DN113994_c0_g1~~TRINITY_DN113994_c0_g1_i1.p1  ORF type:complete len:396 (+),score=129.64 TRINITY_DN113994_c0_g1_i1:98-1285(+)